MEGISEAVAHLPAAAPVRSSDPFSTVVDSVVVAYFSVVAVPHLVFPCPFVSSVVLLVAVVH